MAVAHALFTPIAAICFTTSRGTAPITATADTDDSPLRAAPAWPAAFEHAGRALADLTRGLRAVLTHHLLFAIQVETRWPAYPLPADSTLRTAITEALRALGIEAEPKVAGPSNIGNYLAGPRHPRNCRFRRHHPSHLPRRCPHPPPSKLR